MTLIDFFVLELLRAPTRGLRGIFFSATWRWLGDGVRTVLAWSSRSRQR